MSPAAAAALSLPPAASPGERSNEAVLADYARTARPECMEQLVRANQALVHHVLKRFSYAEEPYEDLVQVGNLGLLKAARNFDPRRGTRFSTYATSMIDGEVRHFLRDALLLRRPRWAQQLYLQIRETADELTRTLGRAPGLDELADAMNLEPAGISEILSYSRRVQLSTWDEEFDEEASSIDRQAVRSRHYSSFSLPMEDRIALQAAVERLTGFQRELVELVFYREFTQKEVADALGCTTRKVGIELQRSLVRLRETLGKRVF